MTLNHYRTDFKKICYVILINLSLVFIAVPETSAQRSGSEVPPLKERLFFGGSFGLQFGTITNIEASPIVGLWVLPRLAVAAGPDYRFYKDPIGRTSIYGGRGYTQIVLIRDINSIIPIGLNMGIFLHAEDEFLSLESAFWKDPPYTSDRFSVNTLLAGGGISQPLGRRGSINMMVLWTLNDSGYDIYGNPEIRVSFTF
jgi:hypothetical protein